MHVYSRETSYVLTIPSRPLYDVAPIEPTVLPQILLAITGIIILIVYLMTHMLYGSADSCIELIVMFIILPYVCSFRIRLDNKSISKGARGLVGGVAQPHQSVTRRCPLST